MFYPLPRVRFDSIILSKCLTFVKIVEKVRLWEEVKPTSGALPEKGGKKELR